MTAGVCQVKLSLHHASDHSRDGNIRNRESWDCQRNIGASIRHVPVECWPGIETHATNHAAYSIEFHIIGSDPGYPAKRGEGLPNKPGEHEVYHHGHKGDEEELLPAHGVHSTERSPYRLIRVAVECFDQSEIAQCTRPDGERWPDQEPTGETFWFRQPTDKLVIPGELTRHSVSDVTGPKGVQYLIATVKGKRLVEEGW